MSDPIKNRYDFVLLFDVTDGNPNGDPDADNMPRIDPDTNQGLVTDVCLKRKIRNRVQLIKAGESGYDIFIREKVVLNEIIQKVCEDLKDEKAEDNEGSSSTKRKGKGSKTSVNKEIERAALMCKTFFDVRAFGAVLSTGELSSGQVRGPVQFTFARSVDPIYPQEHSITRMAVTKEEDRAKERTMGRKYTVPYGLYRAHGFIVPSFAARTGFSEEDLKVFWEAVRMMFADDPSAARGTMTVRKLIVFRHDSALGNAQAAELFERVRIARKDPAAPARAYTDYVVDVDETGLPEGVTIVPEGELGK